MYILILLHLMCLLVLALVLMVVMVLGLGLVRLVLVMRAVTLGRASHMGEGAWRIAPHDADQGPIHPSLEARQV